jgi:hypothetical protein
MPRRAQITKEQRHEQEIYFGADADHRFGIRADGQHWFHTGPVKSAKPAAIDNHPIDPSSIINNLSVHDRPDEPFVHQHEQQRSAGFVERLSEAVRWKLGTCVGQRTERQPAR